MSEIIEKLISELKSWVILKGYAVSKCGVVIKLPHYRKNRWGGQTRINQKVLSSSNDKNGYQLITMRNLGWNKNGQVRLHRLVAHCWIGICKDGYEVNHKDGNKKNNHIDNLEYVTSKQNKIHAVENGLMKTGYSHHNTKRIIMVKDGVELMLFGSKDIKDHGFHPQSVNRSARGERNGYKGWSVSYA